MKKLFLFQLVLVFILFFSCKVNNQASDSTQVKRNNSTNTTSSSSVDTPNQTQSLLDYLRKIPGIQVSGTESNPTIIVRNSVTLSGNYEPLFVIDNNPVGTEFSTVRNMVSVNDIKSITVLKDVASTSSYGNRGANGVIVIHTKKNTDR